MRALPVLLLTLALCGPLGCATTTRGLASPRHVETQLFFGFSHGGVNVVKKDDWAAFVRQEITPRFAEGYTVVSARGHWRGGDGVAVDERARVVLIVHEPGADADAKIAAIRAAYCARFEQKAVLRVTLPAEVSFE